MSRPAGHPDRSQTAVYSAQAERLAWAEWEEEFALYNRASGETHILNAFPAEILRSLCGAPADVHTLAQRLALECGVECTREWIEKTATTLHALHSLELIDELPQTPADQT